MGSWHCEVAQCALSIAHARHCDRWAMPRMSAPPLWSQACRRPHLGGAVVDLNERQRKVWPEVRWCPPHPTDTPLGPSRSDTVSDASENTSALPLITARKWTQINALMILKSAHEVRRVQRIQVKLTSVYPLSSSCLGCREDYLAV